MFPPAFLSDGSALHMSYWQTTSNTARADRFPISYYLLRVWIVPVCLSTTRQKNIWHFPHTQSARHLELCSFVEVLGARKLFLSSTKSEHGVCNMPPVFNGEILPDTELTDVFPLMLNQDMYIVATSCKPISCVWQNKPTYRMQHSPFIVTNKALH